MYQSMTSSQTMHFKYNVIIKHLWKTKFLPSTTAPSPILITVMENKNYGCAPMFNMMNLKLIAMSDYDTEKLNTTNQHPETEDEIKLKVGKFKEIN